MGRADLAGSGGSGCWPGSRTSPGTWPGWPSWCTPRPASRWPTPSWRSCSRSCTSTGRPGTRTGCCGPRRVRSGLVAINQAADAGVPAAGRGRRDRAVELPGVHPDRVDRLRAGRRQRGGVQAQRVHPGRRRLAGQLVRRGRPRAAGAAAGHRVRGDRRATWPAAAVDKIAFTGSAATARKVMAACAENLTPMVAECGGKDAFLVGADADLDAAADARGLGRAVQRRADLHRRGAGLRGRGRLPHVPGEADRAGHPAAARRRPGGRLRADDHAGPGRGRSSSTSRTRWPAAAGRWSAASTSIRRPYVGPVILADVPRGEPGRHRRDLRADGDGDQGRRPGRGRAAGQREPATAWAARVFAGNKKARDGRGPARCAAG